MELRMSGEKIDGQIHSAVQTPTRRRRERVKWSPRLRLRRFCSWAHAGRQVALPGAGVATELLSIVCALKPSLHLCVRNATLR